VFARRPAAPPRLESEFTLRPTRNSKCPFLPSVSGELQ
jgi:hypothetical protein